MARLTGFLRIPNRLLSCRGLSSNQKLVLAYVYSYEEGGKRCTVTRDVMADHLGMKKSTLDDVIKSLYALQILGCEFPKSKSTNRRVLFIRQEDSVAAASWLNLYSISKEKS